MKWVLFCLLFMLNSALAKDNHYVTVAVVDMGIDTNRYPNLKESFANLPSKDIFDEYNLHNYTTGIDYVKKYEDEYHGTIIGNILVKKDNKIKLMDVVYQSFNGSYLNLKNFRFASNGYEVYQRIKIYEKLSSHIGKLFEASSEAGAKVINFSSTHRGFKNDELKNSILKLKEHSLIIVSAGNDDLNLDENPVYPCNYKLENLICVGSINPNLKKADYSNYGSPVGIFTIGKVDKDNEGTSFATPIISKAVATIFYNHPDWSPILVKNELFKFSYKKNNILIFDQEKFNRKYH